MPLTPRQPIDVRRTDRFYPPHCPREDCPAHRHVGPGYRYARNGGYRRACDPQRKEPRFMCKICDRGFSRRTFCTTYRLKRPELLVPTAGLLVAGAALRQAARFLGCSHATVARLSVRLGKHATLWQYHALHHIDSIREPVVLDHLETFIRSQIERLSIGTPVGQRSWYVFPLSSGCYLSPNRRSRRKRALRRKLDPTPPGAIVRSTEENLGILLSKVQDVLDLVSDDHPSYRPAVSRFGARIRHRVYANPDRSPGHDVASARERDRQMFPVDLLHKLIRHCQAHHRRETIAFGRRADHVTGRVSLLAVWRNFLKWTTERRPTTETPAIRIGLTDRRWTWTDILAERLFEQRIAVG